MLGCQGVGVVEAGMVMKVLSYRKVGDHVDTQGFQVGGWADARTQQDRRAAVAAGGQDHLISPVGRAIVGDHAHGSGALEQHAIDVDVAVDAQVPTLAYLGVR